ncbi:MAG: hypothetical protein IT456_06135 [Planctomycetes bacterium]|nr:hypothetical protein [Planctomycetota bacterium]
MKGLAAALLATTLVAQAPTYPHLVLTRTAGTSPATQVLSVDTTTGVVLPLSGFPSDSLPPLAITIDPYNGDPLLALDLGTVSRLVRLQANGTGFVEVHLTDVPGTITDLAVQQDRLLAAVDGTAGGLYHIPRRGGSAQLVHAQPNATTLHGYGPYGTVALLGWTGRPGSGAIDSGVVLVDSDTGLALLGPHTFPNPTGMNLTGAFDLPTGVPRQLLSFADGTFALFAGLIGPPQPLVTSPVVPPGGAVAMHQVAAYAVAPLALGGSAFPFLYEVDPWTGNVSLRSPALLGTPIDFATGLELGAQSLEYRTRCGPVSLTQTVQGIPQPGNTLTIGLQGLANDHGVLVLGLSDFAGGGSPLPLPGGCDLDVAPDAVVLRLTDAFGVASQSIAVPAGTGFLGVVLFAQWLHFDPLGISVSGAFAHRIGL